MKLFKVTLLVGGTLEFLEVYSSTAKSAARFAVAFFQRTTNALIRVKKCEEIQ
jgi:hypothetical protein